MAKLIKWRGKWAVDFRDGAGVRHRPSFDTKREAEDYLAAAVKESRQATQPACAPGITVKGYSERWLALVGPH